MKGPIVRKILFQSIAVVLLVSASEVAHAQGSDQESFVDGVTVGGGLVFYQGDLDANPGNNYLKFLGSSNLRLMAGVDRRYGGYTLGVELTYSRLAGSTQFGEAGDELGEVGFTNNLVALNAVGSIDLGLFEPGLLRLYAGAGPTLLANPQYPGFESGEQDFKGLNTRIRPNLTLGVNIQDAVRIGTMALPTDYVDGFSGSAFPFDQMVFVSVHYRFGLNE